MFAEESARLTRRPPVEEIDLVHLLHKLLSGWKLITAVTLTASLAGLLIAQSSPPRFSTDVLIQVEKKQAGLLPGGLTRLMPEQASGTEPEVEILQSRMLLGKTVRDVGLQTVITPVYFPILGNRWAQFTGTVPPLPDIGAFSIADGKTATLLVGDAHHYTLELDGDRLAGKVGQTLRGKGVSLTVNALNAAPGSRFALSGVTEQQAIQTLKKALSVTTRGSESGMLQLSLSGTHPHQLARTLNLLADNYLQQNVARQTDKEAKSLEFLNQLLAEVRATLNDAEGRLNRARQSNDSVDLNLETKAVLEQLAAVDSQLNTLTFEEAEIAQLYKKEHPTYRALAGKRLTLEKEKLRLNQRVANMPAIQQEIFRLSREVDSGQEVYMQLLTRQQELGITRSGITGNVRIIDTALVPVEPVSPKKGFIIALSTLLGLLAACGFILGRGLLIQRIETPGQLEAQGLNVYTTLPHSAWQALHSRKARGGLWPDKKISPASVPALLCLANPTDLCVEAIRGLRTSLWFDTMETGRNVVIICGATENSGKTFVSTSLATLVAQAGQKVLYIDADMRRGDAHRMFGLDRGEGLSALLNGDVSSQQAVSRFHAGGFDVITRGRSRQDPIPLLVGESFPALLAWAKETYDMVIVDTPPVLAVSDAAIISKSVPSLTLLVTRARLNSLKETTQSITRLEREGVQVKGIVLNGAVSNAMTEYCSGYRSAGYRYQSEDESAETNRA
ncbi:polysaccharide biosynthesis tyrosine autokinase [Enterobacter sp. Ap-916]|uniref:polysaccharide biosynthesis tyrosine autokinase n=1 Tax=unclassified Enterobacter TaxID=2608935 RepID=UPI00141FB71A|nr:MULTISPECIES: polysaccharide biosynthesis tyrosine autokinase [unclassified Enterobacter]NIF58003.1 polysaccharide biosynthesis tyrosine autokinase [Enterobacter sp. Ap-867]NIG28055.1 polysaccharide biosynthesis tyrosine autokinase [Enterobacter sp. Ap-916]